MHPHEKSAQEEVSRLEEGQLKPALESATNFKSMNDWDMRLSAVCIMFFTVGICGAWVGDAKFGLLINSIAAGAHIHSMWIDTKYDWYLVAKIAALNKKLKDRTERYAELRGKD